MNETITWHEMPTKPSKLNNSIKGRYADVIIMTKSGSMMFCQFLGDSFIKEDMISTDTRKVMIIETRLIKCWTYAPIGPSE